VVRALKGLWLHVMPGECFGLLGVNGAGGWVRLWVGGRAGACVNVGGCGYKYR